MNLGFWNFYGFYNANKMFEAQSSSAAGDDVTHPTAKMALTLRALGHTVNTLDRAEGELDAAVFFDHPTFLNSHFRRLRNTRTKLYVFLLENRLNRPDNYWKWLHKDFEKVFTWDPTLIDGKKYLPTHYCVNIPRPLAIDVSRKNKFSILLSSQKYSTHSCGLYRERIDIIRWFERNHPDQFDLFGQRWDRFYFANHLWRLNLFLSKFYSMAPHRFKTRNFPSWRGPVSRKRDVMIGYKFAIVYENAVFPGYLTEKIFDAFFAGCIPVYLGAPDVVEHIPPETFVDRRKFPDNESMYRYLASMTEKDYRDRIQAIEEFVNGTKIDPFGSDYFVDLIKKHVAQG